MKIQNTTKQQQITRFLSVALVVAILLSPIIAMNNASAVQIGARRLTLMAGDGGDGGSMVGGVVKHEFAFTVPSTSNVGSIKFEYCTSASGACVMPTGLVTNGGTTALDNETGATGFTLVKTTNGAPYLTRTASSVAATTQVSYRLRDVTNPTAVTNPPTVPNQTFFVRITTYSDADLGGSVVDTGTVAASTATQIVLDGTMPESLVFCAGALIGLTGGVPDCSKATSGVISFNQLFSPTDTATATSQMSASTNAGSGYTITVNGPTLTSGANTVTGMAVQGIGVHGVSQFGLNLKANTTATSTVAIGAEVDVPSNGTNYRGRAATGYQTIDNFKFVTGEAVADSAEGGAGGSDAQIFTVSYIANVPGSQPAGTYTTTLTYICTPQF